MTDPIIKLSHEVMVQLTAWAAATRGLEFSGLGLVERSGAEFTIVAVDILGVGSSGYTEFGGERQRALPLDARRKVWFHRHPVGDGNPGEHNWSGRDRKTAVDEPFGMPPQLVQWSIAIVLTPGGWVGRIDFHVPTHRVFHVAVEPRFPTPEIVEEARLLLTPELERSIEFMLAEFSIQQESAFNAQRTFRYYPISADADLYDLDWLYGMDDADLTEEEIGQRDLLLEWARELEEEEEDAYPTHPRRSLFLKRGL